MFSAGDLSAILILVMPSGMLGKVSFGAESVLFLCTASIGWNWETHRGCNSVIFPAAQRRTGAARG